MDLRGSHRRNIGIFQGDARPKTSKIYAERLWSSTTFGYTDGEGNPVDRRGNKIDVAEHDVPMYRAYGKHKKYRPWLRKFNDMLAVALFLLFIVLPTGLAAFIILLAAFKYAAVYTFAMSILILFIIIALIFFYAVVLRIPRKRLSFYRKLKRTCKKNKYRLEFKRNFLESLIWANNEEIDFTVKAGKYTYYVKLFGSQNSKSDVTFCHSGELIYRKLRLKSLFTTMFDLKPRVRTRKIAFPKYADGENAVRAIVLNPVPTEAFKKKANGDTDMIGNDETLYGYTVYSGSGFIEAMRRNAENDMRGQREALH